MKSHEHSPTAQTPAGKGSRTSRRQVPALIVALAIAGTAVSSHAADPIDIPTFKAISRPAPTVEIRYGDETTQAIDLFLPQGNGPFPVAVLIHGGCWSMKTAAREQLRHLGADLARRGIAVWSIGYRRADEVGGGYPGTYQDVGTAIDRLRDDARRYRLDLSRTVLVGHSAGGHLALWAASRDRLPDKSALHVATPFVPRNVVSVAGVGDLESFAPLIPKTCGPGIGESLVGKPTAERPDVYADTSPAALPASGASIVMVSGVLDRLVPPYVANDYARAIRDEVAVELVNVKDAGHFDLMATGSAWEEVRHLIEAALGR
jgi:acetyl esterase/lipase